MLTKWAYSIARLLHPSLLSSTLSNKYISKTSWLILVKFLSIASFGWGKGCTRFCGRSEQNCGYHGNRKVPLTYNGKNGVSAFSESPLIGSLSNLLVTRQAQKSWMNLNLCRVGLFTTELFALERSHWLWMGKMVSPSFLSYYGFSLHQTYR